ncbi:MAG: glycosyltransferase 87 family protein, partial [Chloroflexota bacterium]
PILVGISAVGNVQPLLVATLMWTVERRSGPLWVGVASSLKIFPLLFVAVYLGRREWRRAAVALAVAAALWAPALLYDLRGYTTDAGQAASLVAVPVAWVVVIGVGVVQALRLARTRFAWLAAATTVVVSLPRLFVYDVTYLMVGAVSEQRHYKAE